jgi:hypothetical protein
MQSNVKAKATTGGASSRTNFVLDVFGSLQKINLGDYGIQEKTIAWSHNDNNETVAGSQVV